ncbi:MAG: hypothetical protein ACOC54_04215 [Candidatus Sumerlaeota bacterium]
MKWSELEKNLDQYKEEIKNEWPEISSEDIDLICRNESRLLSKLQELYGITCEEARERVKILLERIEKKRDEK